MLEPNLVALQRETAHDAMQPEGGRQMADGSVGSIDTTGEAPFCILLR